MSTPFDIRQWATEAGIETTGGFAVVAECVTMDELERFAHIAISTAAKHWQREHALKAALAEPVQEPVAWMHTNAVGHVYFRKKPQDRVFNPQPLYTTPQRKPLTYGEISKILSEYETNYDMIGFARAIEKAHGI